MHFIVSPHETAGHTSFFNFSLYCCKSLFFSTSFQQQFFQLELDLVYNKIMTPKQSFNHKRREDVAVQMINFIYKITVQTGF